MKRLLLLALALFCTVLPAASEPLEALLRSLDRTLAGKEHFGRTKQARIDSYRLLAEKLPEAELPDIYDRIFREYATFNLDSAILYARRQSLLAARLGQDRNRQEALLNLADIYVTAGMYSEAGTLLDSIPLRSTMYWHDRHALYSALLQNAPFLGMKGPYRRLKEQARDSLIATLEPSDIVYAFVLGEKLNDEGRYADAVKMLQERYGQPETDDRSKAILDYCLAVAYRGLHDREQAKLHFARSARADLQEAVKEYKSLQELAYMLYEDGDVTRAYRYITCAMDDVLSSNSQVRMAEFVPFLTVISDAYETKISQRNRELRLAIAGLAVVLLLLGAAGLITWRQGRRLRAAQEEMTRSYASLKEANARLVDITRQLQEAGYIKEQYLYMYMEQASGYIDKQEAYRRKLVLLHRKGGQEQLAAELETPFDVDGAFREFYNTFDLTFLQLFPTFVEEVNALLRPEACLTPKPGRLMNTELRILALVRLGVTDSVKMAHFLRCSLSTIYNYRTKLRNAAVSDRNDFEEAVSRIGILHVNENI